MKKASPDWTCFLVGVAGLEPDLIRVIKPFTGCAVSILCSFCSWRKGGIDPIKKAALARAAFLRYLFLVICCST